VIHTASVSVKGTTETVLTDSQGRTLYYFTPDTADKVACTGGCATTWPPTIFQGTGTPTGDPTLTGTLSTHANDNGNQILYNNHYLYAYSGDSAAGQANGQGVGNKWYVATPDLK
jgi:predicted lipoprotein with Yx(FWY)xxD motif